LLRGVRQLVGFVARAGADMVVVGSNRHSSLHNLLLGSTSAYLTSHSPTAVLVARAREGAPVVTPQPAAASMTGGGAAR